MSSKFDELWKFITKERPGVITVQEYGELKHVYGLLENCTSYLEVGTAEGNSLYVLTQAMKPGSFVYYIDWAEPHTADARQEVLEHLRKDYKVIGVHGDTNDYKTAREVSYLKFDAVLIDAGHTDFNVAIDTMLYAGLANKYVIFHDIMIPDVNRVFEWYRKQFPYRKAYKIVNSEDFGYGIVQV